MNRREFVKSGLSGLAGLLGFSFIPKKKGLLVADIVKAKEILEQNGFILFTKHRGFDIKIKRHVSCKTGYHDTKQILADNSEYWNSVLYSNEKSDAEVWKLFRPILDQAIDRKYGLGYESWVINQRKAHLLFMQEKEQEVA